MTQLLTPKDVEGIRKQSAAIPHLIKAIIIMAVFAALAGALSLYSVTTLRTISEQNQTLAKDVRECTTPSKPGDEHQCYDQARDDALKVRKTRDDQNAAIQAAADQAASAAGRSADAATAAKAASEFLSNCFKPDGPCSKSAERNQEFIRTQLSAMLERITSTEFRVTEIQGAKPGEPKFVATPIPSSPPAGCRDTIGLGNQAVLPGLLCTKP